MMYFIFSLLASFGIGFIATLWYNGIFEEYFSSRKVYNLNMLAFIGVCLYIGVWANAGLLS